MQFKAGKVIFRPTRLIKEAASKLRGKGGGVNTLSNKKCLVGRTVMIQRALHSSDIGERFTYSECMRTTHRKFSTGF